MLFTAAAAVGAAAAAVAAVTVSVTAAARGPRRFPATPPVACDSSPRVRKEVGSLTDAEWATYQRAVIGLHKRETSGRRSTLDWFERFVKMHGAYGQRAHSGAHFLAWHRLFLLAYENALRTVEPTATIPYWDWSMDSASLAMSPVWEPKHLGGSKAGGPIEGGAFDKFIVDTGKGRPRWIRRGFQSHLRNSINRNVWQTFPDKATIRGLWSAKFSFSRFTTALEMEHNMVHVGVGGLKGDMVKLKEAAGDVAFWSHHAFVDYVWSRRQQAFPSEKYGGRQAGKRVSMNDVLAPFATRVSYAVNLKCVKYVEEKRATRPSPAEVRVAAKAAAQRAAAAKAAAAQRAAAKTAAIRAAAAKRAAAKAASAKRAAAAAARKRAVLKARAAAKAASAARAAAATAAAARSASIKAAIARARAAVAAARAKAAAAAPRPWLACTTHRDCGCGSCVKGGCVIGTTARTRSACGPVASCVRHPRKGTRKLVCLCVDRRKCGCTRSCDCGCGVCRRSTGKCVAPLYRRRLAYCGPSTGCVRGGGGRRGAYRCTGGIRCRSHKNCGCGRCYRNRCVTRGWATRARCGRGGACVAWRGRLVCKAKPTARFGGGEGGGGVDAALLAAAAVRPVAEDSAAEAALAKFKAMMEAAAAKEERVVAEAKTEANIVLSEADADSDAVEALAVAAKAVELGVASRTAAAAASAALPATERAAEGDSRRLKAVEARVKRRAHQTRIRARKELWQVRRESRRRLRNVALVGFSMVNGLDVKRSFEGVRAMKVVEDKVDAAVEAEVEAQDEALEDAEVQDTEEGKEKK